ncbi:hypothetical protein L1049_016072 [Liquidambar formosana]|uniref:J domain-containing protein n=1 Tax=Liquidambar formosana TaxID=63359 RepID=A0AAP0X6Z9_LIQFO
MPSNAAENFSKDAHILIYKAEDNFKRRNLREAIRLAILAKKRYPQFDGTDKFIAAYRVHMEAMRGINGYGLIDFYAVLGISNTLADTSTIGKSYNELVLMVHPDMNSSAASDSAFKLVSEAWDVLSQPSKRQDYDLLFGVNIRPSSEKPRSSWVCPDCRNSCNFMWAQCTEQWLVTCPICDFSFFVPDEPSSFLSKWGLWSSSKKPRSSNSPDGANSQAASSYGGMKCPECGQWCNYGNKNRSYINCRSCSARYFFQSSSPHNYSVYTSSHDTEDDPSVCPFCKIPFIRVQCTGQVLLASSRLVEEAVSVCMYLDFKEVAIVT